MWNVAPLTIISNLIESSGSKFYKTLFLEGLAVDLLS